MENACVHVYHGDGKGKTTAAFGLALRAAGCGCRVVCSQFLKGRETGEIAILSKQDNVTIFRGESSGKFTFQMTPEEKEKNDQIQRQIFADATRQACEQNADLLMMDELLDAINARCIPERDVLDFLDHRPSGLEVVITGRNPSEAMLARADYVTNVKKEKHPYDKGQPARRGVEY